MRGRILLLALAGVLLAAPPALRAQMLQAVVGASNTAAVAGDPQSVTVLANGWQAQTTFHATSCAGATSAYHFTPDATPKVTFAVTSPGFDTAGAATTIARTVQATIWLRQPTANDTLPTETTSGADCVVTYVLSDFINTNDTATASFLSGAYVSGAVTSTAKSGLAVANSSAQAHLKPVCAWVTENNLSVTSSDALVVEVACFHARPRNGKQVQAVRFTASDGTNSATCTSSTMTQSARITAGNPVAVYSCTFGAGAFAGLTAGSCAAGASCAVSVDFTAYPIVGDVTLTASAGMDGTPIAITVRTPNLRALRLVWDQAAKHGPAYAWVQTGGTCATNACVSTSATDPGAGNSANYATPYTAALNCKSYNNANRSHNDTSGCVIYVRAATWNGFDPATSLSTLTVGLSWLTIQGEPGSSNATVVFQRASSSTGDGTVADRTKFVGVGFTQVNNGSNAYNEEVIGNDGAVSTPITTEVLFDGCAFTASASGWPMIYKVGLRENYNTTLTQTVGNANLTVPFGGNREAGLFFGSTIAGAGTQGLWVYAALGNVITGHEMQIASNSNADFVPPTGMVNAFNKVMKSTVPHEMNGSTIAVPAGNYADVQNIYEKTTADGAAAHRFIADADLNPFVNYIGQYNTLAGGRRNFMYNDTGANCNNKQGVILYEAIDPMTNQGSNTKRDTFGTTNAARICNWNVSHGVGHIGRVMLDSANGGPPSSTSWMGEYIGLTGSATPNNEGYTQSVAFTTNASANGSNAGNGTYTITGGSGSPAYGRVPAGLAGLPFDIAGTTRANDGTGCAGAYESC